MGASALSEKAAALSELPREVWGETDFGDLARIRDILTQRRVALDQYYLSSGHAAALGRRRARTFSSAARASGAMGGLDFYLSLRDVLEHWDERAAGLPGILADLRAPRLHGGQRDRELHRPRRRPRARSGSAGGRSACRRGRGSRAPRRPPRRDRAARHSSSRPTWPTWPARARRRRPTPEASAPGRSPRASSPTTTSGTRSA